MLVWLRTLHFQISKDGTQALYIGTFWSFQLPFMSCQPLNSNKHPGSQFKQCVTGPGFSSLLTTRCCFSLITFLSKPSSLGTKSSAHPTPSLMNINVLEPSF